MMRFLFNNIKNKIINLLLKRNIDPFFIREYKKYKNPIASRELIIYTLKKKQFPVSYKELIKLLNISNKKRDMFQWRLKAMMKDKQILQNKKKYYLLSDNKKSIIGEVIGNRDGSGTLIKKDNNNSPHYIYIPQHQMKFIFPNDIIEIIYSHKIYNRLEGKIINIIKNNTKKIIGKLEKNHNNYLVIPIKREIFQNPIIKRENLLNAKIGDFIEVEIIKYSNLYRKSEGKVIKILGNINKNDIETKVLIESYNMPYKWNKNIINEIDNISDLIKYDTNSNRKDIRHIPLITIDGENAQDFDDAVFCEKIDNTWKLLVCIADVSHYVKQGSEIDKEAFKRGNSTYFLNSIVIPMLHEKLSNNLCSLQPFKDRFSLTCEIIFDSFGNIIKKIFYFSIMQSHARLTYNQSFNILKNKKINDKNYILLKNLFSLYQLLNNTRKKNGILDIYSKESKAVFDENKKIKNIFFYERNIAHKIIEELMLIANKTVAIFLKENNINFLYRIHQKPDFDRIENFNKILKFFNLPLLVGDISVNKISSLLDNIKYHPKNNTINLLIQRLMNRASYSKDNIGHFGLGYKEYTHFTSPIRRYCDLTIHRHIFNILNNKKNIENNEIDEQHISYTEKRSKDISNHLAIWLKCLFIKNHIGKIFSGVIVDVKKIGLIVQINNVSIEGIVYFKSLLFKDKTLKFDSVSRIFTSKKEKKIFSIGDTINILIKDVYIDSYRIILEIK